MRWVTISLKTIKQNINRIKQAIGTNCKICAVVKADAYGLNASKIAPSIESRVDYFAVATFAEAKELRVAGITKPILLLYVCENYKMARQLNLHVTVSNVKEAKKARRCAVHVKIDSGMNRFGIKTMGELNQVLKYCKNVVGVYTHLAFEKDRCDKIDGQLAVFEPFRKQIKELFPSALVHAASSGSIGIERAHFDMVRPGKALYGGIDGLGVKTAITIKSKIVASKEVGGNELVGYGGAGTHKGAIGIVPMGYADCFNRNNSKCGVVLVKGKEHKVVGNVCMDCYMVDSPKGVVMMMANKPGLTLMDISRRTNTIVCELLCNLHLKRCIVKYEDNCRQI